MVEATLIIKTCFNNNKSWQVFYDQILGNKSLLKRVHANYVGKSTLETLDSESSED